MSMAGPAALVVAPFIAALRPFLTKLLVWLLVAKGAAIVGRVLMVLGLALFTNEWIVNPMLDAIQGHANGIPPELRVWLSAFAVDRVISIVATAYLLLGAKRVFLGKSA